MIVDHLQNPIQPGSVVFWNNYTPMDANCGGLASCMRYAVVREIKTSKARGARFGKPILSSIEIQMPERIERARQNWPTGNTKPWHLGRTGLVEPRALTVIDPANLPQEYQDALVMILEDEARL